MSRAIRLATEPLRSLAFGSIGAAYMGIGTAIDHKARIVRITNLTNTQLMISFNGVKDHFPLAMYGFLQLDVYQNSEDAGFFSLSIGDRLYVKELDAVNPATSGSVYVTVFYGKDD